MTGRDATAQDADLPGTHTSPDRGRDRGPDRGPDRDADQEVGRDADGDGGQGARSPFGRPGNPFGGNPFVFGFTAALGVLTAWLLAQALAGTASALILIVVSLFLAVGLNPAVEWLERRNLSRGAAIAVVFAAMIVFFVVFGVSIAPALTDQTSEFFSRLPAYLTELQNHPQIRELDRQYQLLDRAQQYLTSGDLGRQAFGGLLGVAGVVISAVFSALTVLILTLYFLASLRSLTRLGYRLLPRSRRRRVQLLGDEILRRVGGYVAGNLLISLIAGVTTFLFLSIAGVPYALALSIIVAITDLIPLVGAVIGAAVATMVGFFVSLPVGIACLVFFVVYQQIENYLIAPRVMKTSIDVPAAATIVAALIGGALLGIVGALLAIPVAAALQLILVEVVLPRQERH
ncbi:AI-2E family transporter [Microtetraspora sp. NBRC 13810]|uniref:AI-2E family transporter n=1 Tax=Microtetraspora sp. NBRC 13810 TaxID=3030990 RepID=UPI0024A3B43B|nr:AI-2E family transporter [Microtetraspora sp. NBRC 13810]GLW12754.1 AI-2E family transporter [Microtetraspora sp. NBRC 13810]